VNCRISGQETAEVDQNAWESPWRRGEGAAITYRQNRNRRTGQEALMLDQSKIGKVVAEQMEAIEADYGDECEIGDVCTIVEVIGPHGSHVRVRSSDMRPHSGLGLIRMAEQAMLGNLGGS
jgi:hypothetical protein